jgi:hypothetical protein
MKTRTKKCKNCGNLFTPYTSLQKFCTESECIRVLVEETKAKEWKKKKAKKKEELMSLQDHLKVTQAIVNKWIRLRDKDEPCISCGKQIKGVKHASHYLSSGGHSFVRFHEDNIWKSCYKCNVMLSGNQIEYRKRLIEKIGVERVEWLESNGSNIKKWTLAELKEIQYIYKQKIKDYEKKAERP